MGNVIRSDRLCLEFRQPLRVARLYGYALLVTLTRFVPIANAQESGSNNAEEPTDEAPTAQPDPAPEEAPTSEPEESNSPEPDAVESDAAPTGDTPSESGEESRASEPAPDDEQSETVEPPSEVDASTEHAPQSPGDSIDEPGSNEPAPTEIEVVVRGSTLTDGADRSARAVTIVDLRRVKLESTDLGGVLSRVEGVNVQRVGGLGSDARFSLAGFDETQIRFFIDGVPLQYSGYPFGLQNVPVNFAERVEVYKGVVPVNLGTDALGGAFNLITDRRTTGTRASASYELGSFGLQRFNVGARHRDESSGFFVKAELFLDEADNDYPIYVDVADRTGLITETKVYRFHDAYRAGGGNVEIGLVDRPWARRFLLRAFATDYHSELQHNSIMTVPYGEAQEGAFSTGGSVRYENTFDGGVTARVVGGYVYARSEFLDDTECIYNWFGQCANPQVVPGEIGLRASDVSVWDHSGFLRGNVEWEVHPDHKVRLATAPTYHDRTGDDRLEHINDAMNAQRNMFKWVNGLEYETHAFAGELVNSAFVKNYLQTAQSEETFQQLTAHREVDRFLWGFGDGLRYDLLDWLFAKASYEYATRLPEPKELFGNGGFILENLGLEPEQSHNVNLTLAVDDLVTSAGTLDGNVTAFFRDADNLIVLFPAGESLRYENVYSARVWGLESAITWLAPGEYVELGGNATHQSLRNTSNEGALALFEGDRIPNKPYFWANAWVRLQKREFAAPGDVLSLTWRTRYAHEFYRNWEGAGRKGPEDSVPNQLTHGIVSSYATSMQRTPQLAFSGEMQNITDERVFDFLGVQRPGRSVFFKTTITY